MQRDFLCIGNRLEFLSFHQHCALEFRCESFLIAIDVIVSVVKLNVERRERKTKAVYPNSAGPTLLGGQGGHGPPIFDAKPNRKSIFGKFVEGDL